MPSYTEPTIHILFDCTLTNKLVRLQKVTNNLNGPSGIIDTHTSVIGCDESKNCGILFKSLDCPYKDNI